MKTAVYWVSHTVILRTVFLCPVSSQQVQWGECLYRDRCLELAFVVPVSPNVPAHIESL